MPHFAEIDNSNLVVRVIVAEQSFIDSGVMGDPSNWIQTSYNTRGGKHYDPATGLEDAGTPLRKNYAGIGCTYDVGLDGFHDSQPYPSWTLNSTTCLWEPPTAKPTWDAGNPTLYEWNEGTLSWDALP